MSIRVVVDVFQMIENAVPRWSCWVSRYISKYFNAMNRSWDSCPVSQNQV